MFNTKKTKTKKIMDYLEFLHINRYIYIIIFLYIYIYYIQKNHMMSINSRAPKNGQVQVVPGQGLQHQSLRHLRGGVVVSC